MSKQIADRHDALSRRLIQQASYELDKHGDRVQASEKCYGAVAHAVKAVAEDRQWRHSSHNLRRQIVGLLANEFGLPVLRHLQRAADELHDNFFEDQLHNGELRVGLTEVTAGLTTLWEVRSQGSNPDYIPSPEDRRTIDRLLISEEEASANPLIDLPPEMPPFVPPEE